MNGIRTFLETSLTDGAGLSQGTAGGATVLVLLLSLAGVAWLSGAVCKRFVTPFVHRLARRTSTQWDDFLLDRRVLDALFRVLPGVVFYQCLPWCFPADGRLSYAFSYALVERGSLIYVTLTFIVLVARFLSQLVEAANHHGRLREHHIVGVVQFVKLIVYCVGGIIVVAFLFGRNPVNLIAGLGAAATVLMLIFRDSILGLVAGIQLSVNRMLKPGDWVTIEKLGINGIVENVSLTTVKIRNFDHTVSTVPPYTLVSDAFQNWDGMYVRGRRRVKRALRIDINTVRFCSEAELEELARRGLLVGGLAAAGERPVNLRLFRRYAENYLRSRPEVVISGEAVAGKTDGAAVAGGQDRVQPAFGWVMARQLEPTPEGLPLEFWFYLGETEFGRYESLAADCMEHLIAMLPAFGLRAFQSPAGRDFLALQA